MPKTNTASSPNPSKFTKVVLQKELKRRGVKFDLSALKPELVSLYRSEILGKLSGFSSDEDSPSVRITRTRSMESRANRLSVSLSRIDTTETDKVSDLTDKQLSAELKKIGVNTGPIGPTTRRIYERKLKNLRDIEGKKETAVPDQEYSNEESDEEAVEVVTTPKLVTRSQKRQASARESATKRRPLHSRTKKEEEIIVKQQPDASVPSAQSSEQESKSKMSPWILVTTFVAIAAFLYFVYITMEENPPRLPFLNRKA